MARAPSQDHEDPRDVAWHPRHRAALVGHVDAEARLLEAFCSGRFHHAWMLTGPRGIGKATLAYRAARFVLSQARLHDAGGPRPPSLDVPAAHPVARRVSSLGHSDLLVVERDFDQATGRVRAEIRAEAARRVTTFFSHTAGEGGWRVCIVDAVDDLNVVAANALLKMLEEPPARALFLLVCHAPGRVLPTIRSRATRLTLHPLARAELLEVVEGLPAEAGANPELASFAAGSPGRLLELSRSRGADWFRDFQTAFGEARPIDHKRLLALADHVGRQAPPGDYEIFVDLLRGWLAERARAAANPGGDRSENGLPIAAAWAGAAGDIDHSIRRANDVNLDRRQALLEAFAAVARVARQSAGAGSGA